MSSIHANNLTVRIHGIDILSRIDLELSTGKVIGLLGPSGAGKTTLMRTIVGLQKKHGGTLTVLGKPAGSRELRREIGYMTQAPAVYSDITVRDNLRYFGSIVGAPAHQADEILASLQLGGYTGRLVSSLSGGQLARVSLAVAMLGSPSLLVLDEPTVGLDPILRLEIWKILHSLARSGTTIIVSSHVMDEAERCDRLVLIREGRVLAQDTPSKIAAMSPNNTVESVFISLIEAAS